MTTQAGERTAPSNKTPAFFARWWSGLSPRTRRMVPVVGTGLGSLAVLGWLFFHDPNEPGNFPACPTKAIFGIDCPGCGSTRALYALIHGNVTRAADHNVLLVLMVPFLLFWYARWAYYSWTGRARPTPSAVAARWQYRGTVALIAFIVVFGLARNFVPYLGSGAA